MTNETKMQLKLRRGIDKSNCNVELANQLLQVSSAASVVPPNSSNVRTIMCAPAIETDVDYETLINIAREPYHQHIYALAAANVEAEIIQRIRNQTKPSCQHCSNVFNENNKISDNLIAKKISGGQLKTQPCSSTLNIIFACDEINQILQQSDQVNYAIAAKTIWDNIYLSVESMYESSQFELHQQNENSLITHKEEFILEIVETFLKISDKFVGEFRWKNMRKQNNVEKTEDLGFLLGSNQK